MPQSAKERMAKYRQRLRDNPVSHGIYKQKERERNMKRKEKGQLKSIDDMSPREQRLTRKRWRHHARVSRVKKRTLENQLTPPHSPDTPNQPEQRSDSMRRTQQRRKKREKAKCYRQNKKLKVKLMFQERLTEKYKKRCNRMKSKQSSRRQNSKNKAYILYRTIINNIRNKYANSKTIKDKRVITSLVLRQRILKKYGMSSFAKKVLGISRRHLQEKPSRKPNIRGLRLKRNVVEFYERDDVSTMKPDKQATITRKGVKKQIRLLTDDVKTLYQKFLSEKNKISYSLFCKLRPFWVIKPREKDRKTCMCKIHDNLNLKLKVAQTTNMISKSLELNDIVKQIVCDDAAKACMYRECDVCRERPVQCDLNDSGAQVSWFMWKNKRVEKESDADGKRKIATRTLKEEEQGSKEVLLKEINTELNRACRHIFNIRHQYRSLRYLRSNMTHEEIIAHIDFSENYMCKYSDEIQAMHFGSSRRQISLHTGVIYAENDVLSFCTASDSLKHGPSSIWAHLDPVLKYITSKKQYKCIHFISDGPTTQYRNKQNVFLWGHKIADYGFEKTTWNFLEAAHGKGAADGVGGAVKRAADHQIIVKKKDITCAQEFVDLLSETTTKIKVFLVNEAAIERVEEKLPVSLQPVPNTMKIHQLISESPGSFAARVVSCFCSHPTNLLCDCYQPTKHVMPAPVLPPIESHEQRANQRETLEQGASSNKATQVAADKLEKVTLLDETLIGRYTVVLYDGMPFPGVIVDVDEEDVEVKVMHRVGSNRYFWPLIDDVLWYSKDKILTLLPSEPEHVTSRHCQIKPAIWKLIEKETDI